jgi:D-alanyl-D-alanine carboxypeptidase (penicillin-binding protein 5/6)
MRFAGIFLFVTLFATSVAFSMEYFAAPPPEPTALSASVVEALEAQSAYNTVSLIAQAAVVIDIDTGVILYERNPDVQLPLASLTKVPLVLAVSEVLAPETIISLPYATTFNSKASQLLAGERWRAKDLIAYTLVSSSNDGAQLLSDAASEALMVKYPSTTGEAAVFRMNEMAADLRLHSMYFLNATGLDESTTQSGAYGSARDVAALFSYAHKERPELFADTATSSIEITSLDGRVARAINTDEALETFPGVIMGKTGLTDLAGGNLALLFTVNGRRYAAVVLGSTEAGRFSDMQQLTSATRSIYAQ